MAQVEYLIHEQYADKSSVWNVNAPTCFENEISLVLTASVTSHWQSQQNIFILSVIIFMGSAGSANLLYICISVNCTKEC
jgi:hypothetical protein